LSEKFYEWPSNGAVFEMSDVNEYDAFISYRRSDGSTVARWLRRELEGYRAPHSMRKRFGRKLRIYLDTAYERGASDFYEQNIKPVLLSSSYLIVVATPDAVRRGDETNDWIAREIADFSAGPNGRNVIAARGAGDFADPLPADLPLRFPNIEIVDLRGATRFWYFNPARAYRLTSEKLKIFAPLLDVPLDDMPKLRQEEERRQQSRIGIATGATLGVLLAVSGLSIFALQSRNQAVRSLEDSMFATGSMVLLAGGLGDDAADDTARTRRLLINQGCDLIDNLSSGSGVDPAIAEFIACRLARARDRENQGEQLEAQALYENAISNAASRYSRIPRADAADGLIQARQAYAEYLLRQNHDDAAETQYTDLLHAARNFSESDRPRRQYARAEAEALTALGDLYEKRGERPKAAASYDEAAESVRGEIDLAGSDPTPSDIEWLARLYRFAGEQRRLADDPDGAIDRYNRALQVRSLIAASQVTPTLYENAAIANSLIFMVERGRGNGVAAEKASAAALAAIAPVLASESASTDLKQQAMTLKSWIEAQRGSN
jgi:tetratricopeptide (TPR) repeat protein